MHCVRQVRMASVWGLFLQLYGALGICTYPGLKLGIVPSSVAQLGIGELEREE